MRRWSVLSLKQIDRKECLKLIEEYEEKDKEIY